MKYEPKPDKDLKELAQRLYRGEIFCDRNIQPEDRPRMLSSVFMVLALAEPKFIKEMQDANIDFIYEEMSKAGPMSVNGYPTFMSCQMLDKGDGQKVMDYYEKIRSAVEDVKT